jgi:hypothetical protein
MTNDLLIKLGLAAVVAVMVIAAIHFSGRGK